MNPYQMRIEDFDYTLPTELIAQHPLHERDASRLLLWKDKKPHACNFRDLPELLPQNSLLVFNDSRVVRARLLFRKPSGAKIEVFCIEPDTNVSDRNIAFIAKESCRWKCYVGNLQRWKRGHLKLSVQTGNTAVELVAEKAGAEGDTLIVAFRWTPQEMTFAEVMEACGHIPLPPYIKREDEPIDAERYQTIFAKHQGSVAAPTAALHFTPRIIEALAHKGVEITHITLHVGAGTFKPVTSETMGSHMMHSEHYSVSLYTLNKLIQHKGRPVIAVGTTSMRTLESLYWLGVKILKNPDIHPNELTTRQWEPYETDDSGVMASQALIALRNYLEKSGFDYISTISGLMIAPGYRFKICNGLITNFHLPKSTLILLVAALIGDGWREVYQFAVTNQFRFLSYGDSSLLLP